MSITGQMLLLVTLLDVSLDFVNLQIKIILLVMPVEIAALQLMVQAKNQD